MQPTPLRSLLLFGTGWLAACGGPSTDPAATSHQPVANTDVIDARLLPNLALDEAINIQAWRSSEVAQVGPNALDRTTTTIVRHPRGGRAPNIPNRLFSNSGAFTFPGGTTAGSASVTLAPVFDETSASPPAFGTGSYDVTAAGTQYLSPTAESIAEVFDDGSGMQYLVVSAWNVVVDPVTGVEIGSVIHLIVPSSDFAIGATVAFDGVDRLALFASGDISQPDPQVAAAAVTGNVTFTAGGLAFGDQISFTLSGDFGEIQWQSAPPPPPPPTVGNIAAGAWTLQYDPTTYVECDGTLLGQEAAFTSLASAAIGFVDGPITITALAVDQLELSGAAIASGFGGGNLLVSADIDAPPGTYVGFANLAGTGPLSTNQLQSFLLLDDSSATSTWVGGQAATVFVTADELGYCTVGYALQLVP